MFVVFNNVPQILLSELNLLFKSKSHFCQPCRISDVSFYFLEIISILKPNLWFCVKLRYTSV